ncbi:hypothetical protein DM02DRAFT_620061 [Periconia macrospinosa]|uniref:SMODS and SLOG-associating 2TM effector domain-containing protein n=1 Tax=Periconia macrospinosa TaxID=97972 RepID=A0A2V1D4T2_9PLEO|nr:hypothetical protein DM02DRAFT_620061 [Periconia macrospinosa]
MEFIAAVFRRGNREHVKSVEDGMTESTYQPQTLNESQATMVADDKLAIFRHLVGIHSTRSFGPSKTYSNGQPDLSHNNLHFDGRAAPNLGIYNRVCHREQRAKRGYKFAAVLINTCLGTQVVVAATLTALGAANSSHTAVTAFGAINTMIAGILTYLKGSGLPNRIRYYEHEWKRIREYIEQRERDFSRPNCSLDVYEIVRVVESMYEEVKADIQTNTPDNYVSVGEIRNRVAASTHPIPRISGIQNAISAHASAPEGKLKELEMKYGYRVMDLLEGLAKKEEGRLKTLEKELEDRKDGFAKKREDIEKELEDRRDGLVRNGEDIKKEVEYRRDGLGRKREDIEKDIESGGSRLVELTKDAKKEAGERRANITRIGEELKNEIQIQRRE